MLIGLGCGFCWQNVCFVTTFFITDATPVLEWRGHNKFFTKVYRVELAFQSVNLPFLLLRFVYLSLFWTCLQNSHIKQLKCKSIGFGETFQSSLDLIRSNRVPIKNLLNKISWLHMHIITCKKKKRYLHPVQFSPDCSLFIQNLVFLKCLFFIEFSPVYGFSVSAAW